MSDLLAIITAPFPKRLHVSQNGYAFRKIVPNESAAIDEKLAADQKSFNLTNVAVVVIPDVKFGDTTAEEYANLVSFAVSLLAKEEYVYVSAVASMAGDKCTNIALFPSPLNVPPPAKFPAKLSPKGAIEWVQKCHKAQQADQARMHVTANRYNRSVRASNKLDAWLDLCISLESLLDAQTEISFRFSVCLAKACGHRGAKAENASQLLGKLYALRSQIVHGSPTALKLMNQLAPEETNLRSLARSIFVSYLLYLSTHTRKDWEQSMKATLLA